MAPDIISHIAEESRMYPGNVAPLPARISQVEDGDVLAMGGRNLEVQFGNGHAIDQIMLFSRSDRLFFAADQVLSTTKPNVSLSSFDPNGNPLGEYLHSLHRIRETMPADTLVFPGHQHPFIGLHQKCWDLTRHYEERCKRILCLCQAGPKSIADLVPLLFPRKLNASQYGFAFREILAYANAMIHREGLRWEDEEVSGIARLSAHYAM
jgi:glyoxylase-like metal-dependent hydrolase (beta-lactamase superfamily II)